MSVSHSERNLGIKRGEIFESWELKALKAVQFTAMLFQSSGEVKYGLAGDGGQTVT